MSKIIEAIKDDLSLIEQAFEQRAEMVFCSFKLRDAIQDYCLKERGYCPDVKRNGVSGVEFRGVPFYPCTVLSENEYFIVPQMRG